MKLLRGTTIFDAANGTLHQETQQGTHEIDLTAKSIYKLTEGGALDFGGSEYAQADARPIEPQKQSPDDDYGWWKLSPGVYRVRFNESVNLPESQTAFVTPHERLIFAGGHHPSFATEGGQLATTLHVSETGLQIKENARLSKLFIAEVSA